MNDFQRALQGLGGSVEAEAEKRAPEPPKLAVVRQENKEPLNAFARANQAALDNLWGGLQPTQRQKREPVTVGSVTYHYDVEQGSEEWFELRRGILTASTMKHVITPAQLKRAKNAKASAYLYEIVAQRIAGYVEISDYVSDDMDRGYTDEITARELYSEHCAPVEPCGFVTNDEWGFAIGWSPDGLVGDDGSIEAKSRRHKFQIETILANEMPSDYLIQVQTGMLVGERKWCDFISYSAGLPMTVLRIYPDDKIARAIVDTAGEIEHEIVEAMDLYAQRLNADGGRYIPTERRQPEDEITV